ncbi:MAG: hypothetical protein AAGB10_22930 [Pseudomonadota bacterium]
MAATGRLNATLGGIVNSAERANDSGQRIAAASTQLSRFGRRQQESQSDAMPVLEEVRATSNADSEHAREAAENCAQALARAQDGLDMAWKTGLRWVPWTRPQERSTT